MKGIILGLLAVALLAGPAQSRASVIYDFTSFLGSSSYTAPAFITTTVSSAGTTFRPDSSLLSTESTDVVIIESAGGSDYFYFADGAFSQFGQYSAVFGRTARLVVRDGTAVPEPGSLALLGLGLAALRLSRKRKAA